MVQISYKLTEDEIYKGLVENSNTRVITKVLTIFGSILLAVMLYLTTVNIINGINYFSMGYAFPMFLGAYLVFLPEATAKMQVPNLIKTKNPFTENVVVRIDRAGFRTKGETFSTSHSWDSVHSIVETKDFYLLKPTESTVTVLPKRAFLSEQTDEFKMIVASVNAPVVKMI